MHSVDLQKYLLTFMLAVRPTVSSMSPFSCPVDVLHSTLSLSHGLFSYASVLLCSIIADPQPKPSGSLLISHFLWHTMFSFSPLKAYPRWMPSSLTLVEPSIGSYLSRATRHLASVSSLLSLFIPNTVASVPQGISIPPPRIL